METDPRRFDFKVYDQVYIERRDGAKAYGVVVGYGTKNVRVQFRNVFGDLLVDAYDRPMTKMVNPRKLRIAAHDKSFLKQSAAQVAREFASIGVHLVVQEGGAQ